MMEKQNKRKSVSRQGVGLGKLSYKPLCPRHLTM
jgi:hypothetical protein